eukprot:4117263-Pyramimonas_sp.AAC.1
MHAHLWFAVHNVDSQVGGRGPCPPASLPPLCRRAYSVADATSTAHGVATAGLRSGPSARRATLSKLWPATSLP